MVKHACKGTLIQQEIGTVYTTVQQVISMDLPDVESETFEADTLDNALSGIPYQTTKRTEGGSMSYEFFTDPVLASFQAQTALLTTPAEQDWKIVHSDAGTTEWPFTGAGLSIGGTVALNDGLKGTASIKLSGQPTWPT